MAAQGLILVVAGLPDNRISSLSRDLRRHLVSSGIPTEPVEKASSVGTRGDITLLGQLALDLISSGSVLALVTCLKAYIVREHKLVIELRHPDGSYVRVSSENISDPTLISTLSSLTNKS